MSLMFYKSKFNGDISKWNVENVENMYHMFDQAEFRGDLSKWKPVKCKCSTNMFDINKVKTSDAFLRRLKRLELILGSCEP